MIMDIKKLRKFIIPKLVALFIFASEMPSNANFSDWPQKLTSQNWVDTYISADGGVIAGISDFIYISVDGGATWSTTGPSGKNWTSIAGTSNGVTLVASENSGGFYQSIDSGQTWNLIASPGAFNSLAIAEDSSSLVASQSSSHLFRSVDGGTTWFQFEAVRNWSDVAITNDGSTVFATVGPGVGDIYKGLLFSSMLTDLGHVNDWYSIDISADGSSFVAASQKDIYVSNDSGLNISPIRAVTDYVSGILRSVSFSNDGNRIVFSEGSGKVQVSLDSGANWNTYDLVGDLNTIRISNNGNRVVVAANPGFLYLSTFTTNSGGGGNSSSPAVKKQIDVNKAQSRFNTSNQISTSKEKIVTRNQIRKKMGISSKRNITYKIVGKNSKVCSLDKSGFYAKKAGRCQIKVITNWKSGKTQEKVFSIRFTD